MKFNIVAMCLCLLAALEVAEARQLLGALTDSPTDIKKVLSGHNAHRKDHQVLPLKWSTKLASGAKIWADGCQFEHSTNAERGNAGENLYASYVSLPLQISFLSYNFAYILTVWHSIYTYCIYTNLILVFNYLLAL